MGAFLVVRAVAQAEGSESHRGLSRASPRRSPILALCMLSCSFPGGIPFVAGFWAKLLRLLGGRDRGFTG